MEITLSSIERYGNPNQIIIVDRCSEDDTIEIAQRHSCKVIVSKGSLGAARLEGARSAQTELIAFVDSDVELIESWQDLLRLAHKWEYEDAGVIGGYYEGLFADNKDWPIKLMGRCGAFGCVITCKKHFLDCNELGNFSAAEDGVYARFLAKKGLLWYIFPVALIHHQNLTKIPYYMRYRWMGAGLRKRDGFQLSNVKRIIGGALFGIKLNNSGISYWMNWRIRLNYFLGYIYHNKYYELDRSRCQSIESN